ncbi:MAG TPA: decarboxylating NADP(+)-dependent phosphogluconate dehydrogenase [Bacillota bacterium]|nr:decarboxylating NADP(+)-dependent phosphogluconate dehydrogenase [Bacillota bacterium]
MLSDIAIVGLAVMGENLALNIESRGYAVSVYNRTASRTKEFIEGRGAGKRITACYSLEELAASLKKPRRVMLMIKAGQPVDDMIEALLPHLEKGDIIIDGGNSHFPDTARRTKYVESKGLYYIGTGVSGGEEGALHGPAMMPGGSPEAWTYVREIFEAICAKTPSGEPCCGWVGEGGAGHFVKMVHNGIEYGDMQLICEAYHLMRDRLGMTNDEMRDAFDEYNRGELDSYLISITRDILGFRDPDGKQPIDYILDTAGQKGTGKWTVIDALDEGIPLTLIAEAVFARCLSALKEERVAASKLLPKKPVPVVPESERKAMLDKIGKALLASKIVSYAQGFSLMRSAAKEYGWNLDLGAIALMWRGGCIIRSVFLGRIKEAYDADPALPNLMVAPWFAEKLSECESAWREVVADAVTSGIPVPAFSSALAYYDGYRSERLPANLLQAQRDYFGAHTYERVDRPRGEFFHTHWF